MTRTVEEALAYLQDQSKDGQPFEVGWCKRETREAYQIPSDGSDSAAEAWERCDFKHPTTNTAGIPRGAFCWWLGGSVHDGHVAISVGNGLCWTVDFHRDGRWDLAPIESIAQQWPSLRFVGWSEDIDGVRIDLTPAAQPRRHPDADKVLEIAHEHRDARLSGRRLKWRRIARLARQLGGTL